MPPRCTSSDVETSVIALAVGTDCDGAAVRCGGRFSFVRGAERCASPGGIVQVTAKAGSLELFGARRNERGDRGDAGSGKLRVTALRPSSDCVAFGPSRGDGGGCGGASDNDVVVVGAALPAFDFTGDA